MLSWMSHFRPERERTPAAVCSAAAVASGALCLSGGLLGLLRPGLLAPDSATAAAIACAGASLLLSLRSIPALRHRGAAKTFSAAAALLPALDRGLHAFRLDGPTLALPLELSGVLLGAALFLLNTRAQPLRTVQRLAAFSACISLLALLGALYRVSTPYLITAGSLAPRAGLLLLLLALGVFCARPRSGWMIPFTDPGSGGTMARRLLPAAVLLPYLLGALKVYGIGLGYSGVALGPVTVLGLIVLSIAIIGLSAQSVLREEGARRAAEHALWETQERLTAILDNTTSLIALTDVQGRFLVVNRRLAQIAGKSPAELIGKSCDAVLSKEAALLHAAKSAEAVRLRSPVEWEERLRGPEGESTYLCVRFPILDGHGRILGIGQVATDITQRKLMELELQKARDELQKLLSDKSLKLEETSAQLLQAQKMEAVGRLAGGIAHDLNNVLTAIGGFGEMLAESLLSGDPRREDVEEIRRAGARATSLTRQLLAFSRRQILHPKVLDLNALIAELEKMLRRLLREDIELAFKPGERPGFIEADPSQVEQVLMNLAVNARDAMPRGGVLAISTEPAFLDEAFARAHPGSRAGAHVLLAVSDTGCGMDEGVLSRIFEPFFTTKEPGKGTGLGLSTVYGIVKQSGGYIQVESRPGAGATFRIYFPATAKTPASPEEEKAPAAGGGGETLLLVEDDAAVRKPISRFLVQSGYTVLEAGDPEEALRTARAHAGRIDLLLSDIVMPKLRGYELARLLAESRPDLKTLYMTGYADEGAEGLATGPKGYRLIQKPVALRALAQAIREALES